MNEGPLLKTSAAGTPHFVSANDVADINALVQKALLYKADPFKDSSLGKGKRIGCLFLNPSMRTRLSTQIAAQNLGMEAIVFNVGQEGWSLEFEEEAIMSGNTVERLYREIRSLRIYEGASEVQLLERGTFMSNSVVMLFPGLVQIAHETWFVDGTPMDWSFAFEARMARSGSKWRWWACRVR